MISLPQLYCMPVSPATIETPLPNFYSVLEVSTNDW